MERTVGWQLDQAGAKNYERFLVPAVMDPWARRLVDAVGLESGWRVLDVACGTGVVARHAAAHVGPSGTLVGVDLNPAMLAVARAVTADLEPSARWEQSPAEELPFGDAAFDAALCQQGLQFFSDRSAALGELHRVTAPGGRIGLSTCRPVAQQPGYAALVEVVTRHVGAQAGEIVRSPYALGDLAELRALVEEAGFADVHVTIDVMPFRVPTARALLEGETASSPLGDVVAALDPDVVDGLVHDLARALAPHTDDDGIVFPFETLVLTARRP